MNRVKTFDAAGIAPSGVLYAGDLNAIQDAAAALSDLTQNIQVSTVALGETGLLLVRYGTGEARITGGLRVDNILRGLGGVYAGAFTTVQRDAIAVGSRPYGLVILNTNTNRLEMNYGTDPTPSWGPLGVSFAKGSSIPAVGPTNANSFYFDQADNGGTLKYSDGTTWTKVSKGITEPPALHASTHASGGTDPLDAVIATVPVGSTMGWPWASSAIPSWTVLPYGNAIPRAGHTVLASLDDASGNPHGVSSGNIVLPDERGRVEVGRDDMGGTAANRITAAISGVAGTVLGAVFGAEGVTLTTAQIPAHNHPVTGTPGISDPTHTNELPTYTSGGGPNFAPSSGRVTIGTGERQWSGAAGTGITISAGSLGTSNAGSGSAHANTQPSIIVNRIMRVV